MPPGSHICSKAKHAIEIKNLHKAYSGTRAISDLSLNVPAGSFFGLLGPNGSGKTSTLRILATLASADSGEVLINGIDARKNPREVRKLIGYVGQEASIDKILTGAEHLRFTSDLHHLSSRERNRDRDLKNSGRTLQWDSSRAQFKNPLVPGKTIQKLISVVNANSHLRSYLENIIGKYCANEICYIFQLHFLLFLVVVVDSAGESFARTVPPLKLSSQLSVQNRSVYACHAVCAPNSSSWF